MNPESPGSAPQRAYPCLACRTEAASWIQVPEKSGSLSVKLSCRWDCGPVSISYMSAPKEYLVARKNVILAAPSFLRAMASSERHIPLIHWVQWVHLAPLMLCWSPTTGLWRILPASEWRLGTFKPWGIFRNVWVGTFKPWGIFRDVWGGVGGCMSE